MAKASSELQVALAKGVLRVRSRVVGEVAVQARHPETGAIIRVGVTSRDVDTDLINFAPIAAWRASDSLRTAVASGFLQVMRA